nr:hypothetical protein [Kiritimatiellia bacterium]
AASGDDLGSLMVATTNIWQGATMTLVTKVGLPDGYVHVELADVSGEFTVWCCNPETGGYVKLVDSQSSPTTEIPMSAWRRFTGRTWGDGIPYLPVHVTSSSPGTAKLRLRYWNYEGGELMEDEAEQKITALGFVFKTPTGDPVSSPQTNDWNRNEYTYNDSTATLSMTLRVEVTPALPHHATLTGRFSLPFIGGASLEWAPENPYGEVSSETAYSFVEDADVQTFTAHATYRGYPTHNSGFGRKTVTFECGGNTISQDFEVFFPKEGTHHPPCSMCSNCPNWFYYWRDGGVCGINDNCRYDGITRAYGYCHPGSDNLIRLGSIAADALAGPTNYTSSLPGYGSVTVEGHGKGIQCVAEVLQHEQHHIDIYNRFHEQGEDPDGDGVPTSVEGTLDGISTHPDNPNTYNLDPDTYQNYGDNEIRCRKIEMTLSIPIFPNLDWSNPGCQHKNQFGPVVP